MAMRHRPGRIVLFLLSFLVMAANADPLARPGDLLLRHDIRLLVDEGMINVPLGTWPIPWADIIGQLDGATAEQASPGSAAAMLRLRERARRELDTGAA